MGSEDVSFDVYGVCTTRDIFGLVPYNKYPVKKYFQLSFPPAFDPSNLFSINPLTPDDINAPSGYIKRICAADLNRTVVSDLENSGANWIIIDVRSVPKGLWEVKFGGETHYYSLGNFVKMDSIRKSIEAKGLTVDSIRKVKTEEVPKMDEYLDSFCDFLKKRYGKNIIMVEMKEAMWLLDKSGNVTYMPSVLSEYNCKVMDEYFMKILKKLDCHYIRTPPNIIYDSYNHFGDAYRVHYVQEWYDYANKCIDLITSGSKNCYRKMDILNIELTNKMDLIRGKNILSRTNACGRFDVMFKLSNNNPAKLSGLIKVLTEALDSTQDDILKAEIYGRIGRAYRDKRVGSDLVAAAEWMRKAADGGIGWANKELFEILWKIDTPESLMEMTSRAYAKAEAGDPDMMGLIGRAFWKGKGIEKDLQSAETWLKKSADAKCQWAKEEYFDLLWDIGTPESLKNMIEYASSESSKGNLMMRARLAKAYC